MYLITDHVRFSESSHVGTEAAASHVPPSSPGLRHDWPCPEIWGIWSKGDGEGGRPFAKLLLHPLLLLRIQVGTVQWWTPSVRPLYHHNGAGSEELLVLQQLCWRWLAWKEPLEQLQTTSLLPGTMSPSLLDLQDLWVWEDALTASSCALKQTAVFRWRRRWPQTALLLMQEECWKSEHALQYFPIFLAHRTTQTSPWCSKYRKHFPERKNLAVAEHPTSFQSLRNAVAPWNDLSSVSP